MKIAFKEWAVVVDALGTGKQSLILRKGGISEGRGGFKMEHSRFLLFPTHFHQQRDSVVEPARLRFDELQARAAPKDRVRLEYFAEVLECRQLHGIESARALKGRHVWRDEVVEKRFDWGGKHSIHALAVRVWRLKAAADLPLLPEYAGCKSWIELAVDVPTEGSVPVLNDEESAAGLAQFTSVLPAPMQ